MSLKVDRGFALLHDLDELRCRRPLVHLRHHVGRQLHQDPKLSGIRSRDYPGAIFLIVLMGITHFVKNHFVESVRLGQV